MSWKCPFPRPLGLVLVPLAVVCGACAEIRLPTAVDPVATITVSPNPAAVAVGVATTLAATLKSESNQILLGRSVAWTSSDGSVATVDRGVVTGLAEGSATITATSEGKQGSTTVNVTPSVGSPGPLAVSIASYLGGSAFEHARDVAVDAAGNVYIVGGTMSPAFPTTPGAFQRIHNPGIPAQPGINPMDAFVVKLSPGGQIIWSTLLGGPNYDRAYAVEVDAGGNVYVAGRAGAGFPVTAGALQTTFQGGQEAAFYGPQDGFICKLNASGSTLHYCSYFGTTDPQIIRDVAIDTQGNAYLATSARQDGLPSAWFTNAFQTRRAGGVDGVVAKIDPSGTRVVWATYLGGPADEGGGTNSVRVDASGNVYFLQGTSSSSLPTPGGFDKSLGGAHDLYLAKIAPDGAALLFATYVGGSAIEFGETHNLALDAFGNTFVAATTSSTDFPTTPGAFQTAYGGSGGTGTGTGTNYPSDAAVVKISPTGVLLAGTYLGGSNGEGVEGIGLDAQGDVYLSGGTFSSNFPTTTPSFQNRGGRLDAFVTRLAASFATLLSSQRIGGSGNDVARATAVDGNGNMYVVGEIGSSDFPVLSAFQTTFGGNTDALFVGLVLGH